MSEEAEKPLEAIVLDVVGRYVSRKLKSKHDLEWKDSKASQDGKDEYSEKRAKIAKDAFLAVRARTGADFIDYFASTICSVPQHLPEASFLSITQHLFRDTDRVRTLTLLALSARS